VLVVEIPEKRDEPLLLRAMVGSVDYYDATDGQVNGVCSIRSAGSTLKPFIYALAIDLFNYRPWTLLDDAPIGFETDIEGEIFQPQNYDMKFWGTITLRDALATSRNIPAVYLVKKIGEEKFYAFLQKAGFDHLRRGPAHHGPGMALGSAGASLFELVMAYAGLAMQGEMRPLCIGRLQDGAPLSIGTRARLCSGKAALYITHILSDREARRRAFGKRNFQDFPFEVASKTGTSSDYRDAWIIGYTSKYVVGVWVGDFSGKKMQGVSGGYGAGRVFHQVMRFLEGRSSHRFGYPPSWKQVPVCRVSGKRAGNNCPSVVELAGEDDKLETMCNTCLISTSKTTFMLEASVPKIISPTNGEVFLLDPHINITNQRIPLIVSATGGAMSGYSYALDEGALVPLQSNIGQSLAAKPGKHVLRLYKDNVVVQTVHFRVEQ
jgi:penicillin-binding protein 1C